MFGNSFMIPSPGRVSIPNTFVSLFVFYILSYLLSKRMGCLSVCLVFSASIQKLFCGTCSAFKGSFDEFVGEKVVSASYSSTILGLPPLYQCFCTLLCSLSLSYSLSHTLHTQRKPSFFFMCLLQLNYDVARWGISCKNFGRLSRYKVL